MQHTWYVGLFVAAIAGGSPSITFNKDVLPILQHRYQACHRPGEVAPMSFLSYESTRPWAKAIKSAVETDRRGFAGVGSNLEGLYLPGGGGASDYRLFDSAKLIPAGTDIYIAMHYTPNGRATVDQTQVGFTLAKEEPKRRYVSMLAMPPQDEESFRIPAGEPNWKSGVEVVFNQDADLVWFSPHMHGRGKDMTFRLIYPTGESETALRVPHYQHQWQFGYQVAKPIRVPKGTRMEVVAHFDNSPNNPSNPNPNKDVWWGEQTFEEMMGAFFAIVVDKDMDPRKVLSYAGSR